MEQLERPVSESDLAEIGLVQVLAVASYVHPVVVQLSQPPAAEQLQPVPQVKHYFLVSSQTNLVVVVPKMLLVTVDMLHKSLLAAVGAAA
jgi:hypothetical protein